MKLVDNASEISDREFVTYIYQEYKRIMYATVKRYCSDYHCCEEIMQECCARLTRKVEVLKGLPTAALASYVVATARNTAITYLRKTKKYQEMTISMSDLSESVLAYEEPLDQYMLDREFKSEMRAIWAKLDEEARFLLEGKYYFGYDNKELAALLGCKVDSVRMKLTRARRQLKKLLEEVENND